MQDRGGGLGSDLPLDALDALRDELGDDLALRSVTFSAGQLTMEVRVPGSRDELDNYRFGTSGLYGGEGLSEPTPVPGASGQPLEQQLFRPERIAFDEIDALVDEALAAADIDGAFASGVSIRRLSGGRATISVDITGPRDSVTLSFSADGERIGDPPS